MSHQNEIIERELCRADEMNNNTMKEFEINIDAETSVKVLLIKYENEFSCLASKCTHYSVPLSMGVLHNGRLRYKLIKVRI
jgi:nitrite reductase/ring-hydroxylating ferredoxin subunit